MSDTPKHEPEVTEAIAIPDPRIRRLKRMVQDHDQAVANLEAIISARVADEKPEEDA